MAGLDLDQKRAARAEAVGGDHTVTFGGQDFTVPPELPLAFVEALNTADFREAVDALFGKDQGAQFWSHCPTMDDLMALQELYAVPLPTGSPSSAS